MSYTPNECLKHRPPHHTGIGVVIDYKITTHTIAHDSVQKKAIIAYHWDGYNARKILHFLALSSVSMHIPLHEIHNNKRVQSKRRHHGIIFLTHSVDPLPHFHVLLFMFYTSQSSGQICHHLIQLVMVSYTILTINIITIQHIRRILLFLSTLPVEGMHRRQLEPV